MPQRGLQDKSPSSSGMHPPRPLSKFWEGESLSPSPNLERAGVRSETLHDKSDLRVYNVFSFGLTNRGRGIMRPSRVLARFRAGKPVSCFKLNLADSRAADLVAQAGFDCISVSYTHLTLPTIYSV